MRFLRPLSLLILWFGIPLLFVPAGFGALAWDSQRVELTALHGAKEAVGIFRFANVGGGPITITTIQPSCGCTTAELAKRTYAPGESGEIKAVFNLGDMTGVQEKSIAVTTDDAPGKPVSLILHVTIPERYSCTPRLLLWRMGEKPEEKFALIAPAEGQRIAAVEIKAVVQGDVATRTEQVEAGSKYRLYLRPANTATLLTAGVSCLVRFADGTSQPFTVNVLVR